MRDYTDHALNIGACGGLQQCTRLGDSRGKSTMAGSYIHATATRSPPLPGGGKVFLTSISLTKASPTRHRHSQPPSTWAKLFLGPLAGKLCARPASGLRLAALRSPVAGGTRAPAATLQHGQTLAEAIGGRRLRSAALGERKTDQWWRCGAKGNRSLSATRDLM